MESETGHVVRPTTYATPNNPTTATTYPTATTIATASRTCSNSAAASAAPAETAPAVSAAESLASGCQFGAGTSVPVLPCSVAEFKLVPDLRLADANFLLGQFGANSFSVPKHPASTFAANCPLPTARAIRSERLRAPSEPTAETDPEQVATTAVRSVPWRESGFTAALVSATAPSAASGTAPADQQSTTITRYAITAPATQCHWYVLSLVLLFFVARFSSLSLLFSN